MKCFVLSVAVVFCYVLITVAVPNPDGLILADESSAVRVARKGPPGTGPRETPQSLAKKKEVLEERIKKLKEKLAENNGKGNKNRVIGLERILKNINKKLAKGKLEEAEADADKADKEAEKPADAPPAEVQPATDDAAAPATDDAAAPATDDAAAPATEAPATEAPAAA